MLEFKEVCKLLADQLKAELSFQTFDDGGVEGVLKLDTGGGRRQEVHLEDDAQDETPFLRITSTIGEASKFGPEKWKELLMLNGSLLYGAFTLMDGNIVLNETAERNPVDLRRSARVIEYLAGKADQFERMLFGVDRS